MPSSKAATAMSRSCLPAAIRAWKIAFSRLASVRCLGQGTLTVMVSSGTAASFLLGVERTLRALLGQVWDLTGGLAPGGRYLRSDLALRWGQPATKLVCRHQFRRLRPPFFSRAATRRPAVQRPKEVTVLALLIPLAA